MYGELGTGTVSFPWAPAKVHVTRVWMLDEMYSCSLDKLVCFYFLCCCVFSFVALPTPISCILERLPSIMYIIEFAHLLLAYSIYVITSTWTWCSPLYASTWIRCCCLTSRSFWTLHNHAAWDQPRPARVLSVTQHVLKRSHLILAWYAAASYLFR